jgi:phenylacetic acid degradation protein paaN
MSLSEKNQLILENAVKANHERTFYAQYPEHPKAYGEESPAKGLTSFNAMLNKKFTELLQNNTSKFAGEEVSPYTQQPLGITYPIYTAEDLITHANSAFLKWRSLSVNDRANLLIEALEQIKNRFFDIAYATMHTTGQSFIMSFQASGPHSNDRSLEAIAMGYNELKQFPEKVIWEKPMGKISVKLEKTYHAQPKGIGLVIGCSTFPVWNTVPGLFADLTTGNTVIVKPHPKTVLPIAIVVAEIQKVLKQNNIDPNVVQLGADSSEHLIAKELAEHPDVKLIDYTGSTAFGNYVESLKGKVTFTEKAGVNSVILDSVKDIDAVMQNLAFSVSLYSGQMCTAPQNFFIPETGIKNGDTTLSFHEVVEKLQDHINMIVGNPKMAAGTFAAIQSAVTANRVQSTKNLGAKVLVESNTVANEEFANARTASPTLLEVASSDSKLYENELFGPISIVIKTKNTDESIALAAEMARVHGAITCAAYSTDESVINKIENAMSAAFVPVSFNLTGPIWVNQNAAFSDFHVTGGNPAGNASFTNPEFIVKRFVWVGHRRAV